MKFLLISPKNRTVYNFRGDLLREIASRGYDIVVTGPNRDGLEKINELGALLQVIPLDKNGFSIIGDLRYLSNLYRLIKAEKPDVVLAYTIKPNIYGSIAAKLAGVKNINTMVTGAGYAFTAKGGRAKFTKLMVSILYRIAFTCTDRVIFQNKDDLRQFTELGLLKPQKCRLVDGSGVNMELFPLVPFPEITTFFMLSRVIASKGVMEYLQAASQIKSKYPKVRFMLLGAIENISDSLKEDDLAPYIKDGVIEYFGETDDVASYYRQCSVYVLSSYREGIPRTVLEAMAMGRPILTTDVPGCRETVVEGRNGFLIPARDSDALAQKMEWFIQNEPEIARMGTESYKICLEKFQVEKINEEMLKNMGIDS